MMKEIFTNYGPVWELWWDGANGEGPNGKKQVYDWDRFKKTVRQLSPNTVIFSDVGPDIRWCGNEKGIAGETNWNLLDTVGFTPGAGAPPVDTLNRGNESGKNWIPAECDVSIRPGWFYHKEEDEKVKSPEELFQLYLRSVGRGANLLLNVPPDRNGRICEQDSVALIGFRRLRNESFNNVFVECNSDSVVVNFEKPMRTNCIVLKESLNQGQKVSRFRVHLIESNNNSEDLKGTTIGSKRIITFSTRVLRRLYLIIDNYKIGLVPKVSVSECLIPENLIEK
jgi:alpha-L-fucosidase